MIGSSALRWLTSCCSHAGPLYGDWQAFIKQHQAAAQNLQHQQRDLNQLLPTLSGGGGPGSGRPAAYPLQTVSAGAGTVFGGRVPRPAIDSAELRTFSGGFQPYKRSAAQVSREDGLLKRSISSSRIDGASFHSGAGSRNLLVQAPALCLLLLGQLSILNNTAVPFRLRKLGMRECAASQHTCDLSHMPYCFPMLMFSPHVSAVPPRKRLHAGYWENGEQQ